MCNGYARLAAGEPGWGQEGDGWRNLLAGSEIAVDEPEVE